MPRHARHAPGGFVYHALNRAVARLPLFQKEEDYAAFERVLGLALEAHPIRILSYCLMPNHWHFVLWPRKDGEMSAFLRWLTHTHSMRWHAHHQCSGSGHLYQGRFKSFPVETDEHLYTVLRYVERNPLRARLVRRAENWRWSSLWRRGQPDAAAWLSPWPVETPANWVEWVNQPQTSAELAAVRHALQRGSPFGSLSWQQSVARRLRLQSTLRPRGRPRKSTTEEAAE